MDADDPDLQVRPDDYRATSADVVLSARLHSSLAVCLYDCLLYTSDAADE